MNIQFLNVDLEIESYHDLQPIVEEFGDKAFNLYCGKTNGHYLATFELSNIEANADSIISDFCTLIKGFGKETKELWDKAFTKVFDIGYSSSIESISYSSSICAETLEQVAALGASLKVTIYPPTAKQ